MKGANKPLLIGGIGEPTWKGEDDKVFWSQGYRIYDSEGVATTIQAIGGGIGSHSGLYLVKEKSQNTP